MKILILGGGGMIGQKFARDVADNPIQGAAPELVLYDIVQPAWNHPTINATCMTGNIADAAEADKLASLRPDLIVHLAAIVSGDAEANFLKGWDINAMGGWSLLEALRKQHDASSSSYVPKFIFSSSIAVFGGPFPDVIDDDFLCAPQTSYGAQKAMVELLIADYSRKGYIDGVSMRLPTICVRPGKPNLAASSFFSGIIREPLNGQAAVLPVPKDTRHWHASPKSAIRFLRHAATLDFTKLGGRRAINLPGVSCTVEEQIDALRTLAGNNVIKLIKAEPNETIQSIVKGWPRNFAPARAIKLGFTAEDNFTQIIQSYIENDLNL